jgi:hypothetical protein
MKKICNSILIGLVALAMTGCAASNVDSSGSSDQEASANIEIDEESLSTDDNGNLMCPQGEEVLQWSGQQPKLLDRQTEWILETDADDVYMPTYFPFVEGIGPAYILGTSENFFWDGWRYCFAHTPEGAVVAATHAVLHEASTSYRDRFVFNQGMVPFGMFGYSLQYYNNDYAIVGIILCETDPMLFSMESINSNLLFSHTMALKWINGNWRDLEYSEDGHYTGYVDAYILNEARLLNLKLTPFKWSSRIRGIEYYNYIFWNPQVA